MFVIMGIILGKEVEVWGKENGEIGVMEFG